MKKALKILMLALLVVPCALVFTACSKNMNASDVSRYLFDSYKKLSATGDYETWKDAKIVAHSEMKTTTETKFEVGEDTVKKDVVNETVTDTTLERKGQKENTVIAATTTNVTTLTTYQLNADEDGLDCVVTKTTTISKLYIGKLGTGTETKYYVTYESRTEGSKTVNGEEDKDYAGAEGAPTTLAKTVDTLEDEAAFEEAVTEASESLFEENFATPYALVDVENEHLTATKNGKNVTFSIEQEAYESGSLVDGKVAVKFNDNNFTGIEFVTDTESYNATELTTTKIHMGITGNVTYASNATFTEANLNDLDDGDVVLSDVLSNFSVMPF